jgi:hypothetical protein
MEFGKLMIWENFMPSLQAMDITLQDYSTRALAGQIFPPKYFF